MPAPPSAPKATHVMATKAEAVAAAKRKKASPLEEVKRWLSALLEVEDDDEIAAGQAQQDADADAHHLDKHVRLRPGPEALPSRSRA